MILKNLTIHPYLSGLTDGQVNRLYNRIHDHLERLCGSKMGWDWPTLRACYPGVARALKLVGAEISRRIATTGKFDGIEGVPAKSIQSLRRQGYLS